MGRVVASALRLAYLGWMVTPPDASAPPSDYEAALQVAYESFLEPGDVVIDVGAHRGRHTLPIAARVLPSGRVLAFEPLPALQAELQSLLRFEQPEAGDALRVLPFALAERSGRAEFVVARDAPEYSGLKERVYDVPTALERIQVEVRTLDELTADLPRLRYIKIDAEGGEFHILGGARALLRRLRPLVSFEFGQSSFAQYGISAGDMFQLLGSLEYTCFDIRGRLLAREEAFVESATRQEVWDYLAIPSEQVEVIRSRIGPALEAFFSAPLVEQDAKEACRSRLEVVGARPVRVAPGSTVHFRVRVTNASPVRWERKQHASSTGIVRLGIIWHQRKPRLIGAALERASEGRVEVPLPLAPGEGAVVTASLRPVAYDGTALPRGAYEVWLSPLIEGVTWFTDRGDAPLKLPVAVE